MGFPIETTCVSRPNEVVDALTRLGLESRAPLVRAADEAYTGRLGATDNHPPCAGGMFSFLEGVRALRDALVGDRWTRRDIGGVSFVQNPATRVRVGFWNVDRACDIERAPIRNSEPGPFTAMALHDNRQGWLDLDASAATPNTADWTHWFLMVGEDGTAELSLVDGADFVVRLFIVTAEDIDPLEEIGSADETDVLDESAFDVPVSRKR